MIRRTLRRVGLIAAIGSLALAFPEVGNAQTPSRSFLGNGFDRSRQDREQSEASPLRPMYARPPVGSSDDNTDTGRPGDIRKVQFEKSVDNIGNGTPPGELFQASKVLAIVAGEPIFAGDLLLTINEIIQTKASDAPPFVKEQMREQGIRELLPRAIERKLFYHQAVQMLPDPTKVAEIESDLFRQLEEKQLPVMLKKYQARNATELDGRLRMLGSSWRAVKAQAAEQEIAKFAITNKIQIDTEISHDRLYQEYMNNRDDYRLENQVRWEHLMVSFANHPQRMAAKKRLAEMGNQVIYGADLTEVAKQHSDGFYASKGGQNDWTKRGSLKNRTLEDVLFEIPEGKLSDIVESSEGFHIVRVLERQEAGFIPFEEVQAELREAILNQRQKAATEKLLNDVKKRIPYEILVDGIEF